MAILNYSDFVTTTFASAAHHTKSLPSFQNLHDLGNHYVSLVDELNLRLDRLHVGMAFAGEMLEYQIELEGVKSSAPFQDTSAEMKEVGDLCYYLQMIINLYDLPGITLEGAYEEPNRSRRTNGSCSQRTCGNLLRPTHDFTIDVGYPTKHRKTQEALSKGNLRYSRLSSKERCGDILNPDFWPNALFSVIFILALYELSCALFGRE